MNCDHYLPKLSLQTTQVLCLLVSGVGLLLPKWIVIQRELGSGTVSYPGLLPSWLFGPQSQSSYCQSVYCSLSKILLLVLFRIGSGK